MKKNNKKSLKCHTLQQKLHRLLEQSLWPSHQYLLLYATGPGRQNLFQIQYLLLKQKKKKNNILLLQDAEAKYGII